MPRETNQTTPIRRINIKPSRGKLAMIAIAIVLLLIFISRFNYAEPVVAVSPSTAAAPDQLSGPAADAANE